MDDVATSVMSACLRMSEIIEAGVAMVENIKLSRCHMPKFEVIYFCEPTVDNFSIIVDDEHKNLYTAAHVYTTSTIADETMKVLKDASRVKTLSEVNMEYLAIESSVFTLSKTPEAFGMIYGADATQQQAALEQTATQLSTLCATLNENPIIRFYGGGRLGVCKTLAGSVKAKVGELVGQGVINADGPRAQLLIVDRSVDITSTLLHEFTYQAMVNDLVPLDGDLFNYAVEKEGGARKVKVLLNEQNDQLWTQLRHKHIADTVSTVTEGFQTIAAKNKSLKIRQKDGKVTAKDLSEAMKAMPEYREKMEKYQTHIGLCQMCFDNYKDIQKLTELEQDLATKEDENGNKIRKIADYVAQLTPIFQSTSVAVENKLRLLLLYVFARGGIKDSDLQLMEKHASIPEDKRRIARNLKWLGLEAIGSGGDKARQRMKRKDDSEVYKSARWVPILKDIMEEAVNNTLSEKEFQFIDKKEMKALQDQNALASGAASARSTKPGWANRNRDKAAETKKKGGFWKADKVGTSGSRVIVFVIGSMSYSEMRCAYEVTQSTKREIIIGSNCALSPNKFLNEVETLSQQ